MITFNQYLTELFDNPHPYVKSRTRDGHAAHFVTDKGHHYHVDIHHYEEKHPKNSTAHVEFHTSESETPNNTKVKINHQEGHSSVRVFSTVHHIIKDHLEQHPHIKKVMFAAAANEPSRGKLYSHFSKRVAHKHEEKKKSAYTSYTIHRDDIKG